jgi:hypothetical protein
MEMENSQLDSLLCTLNFWVVGGGERKKVKSKFPSWISSMDKKRSFLLKGFQIAGFFSKLFRRKE